MDRNLDGYFFRIKRNGKFQKICFSDLTIEEREEVLKDKDTKWLKRLCSGLADCLKAMGDAFDLIGE